MNYKAILILTFVIFNFAGSAQNIDKIEKKLAKLYEKQKTEKFEKKALKLKKKYPKLEISYYFLSKIEIDKFKAFEKIPNKKQWNYLRKASGYSRKLGDDYQFWQDSLKYNYIEYIESWNDSNYESTHLKKVIKTYVSHTKDTITLYYNYYGKKTPLKPSLSHDIPVTDSLRTALLKFASNLVGIPYKYAGEKPEVGFDCSGFVLYVYKSIGIELPHNAHLQSKLEGETLTLENAKPGDLIFFGSKNGASWSTQHAGIIYEYTENEPKVIHCVSRGVSIDGNNSSWDHYWKERILFVKRLPQLKNAGSK